MNAFLIATVQVKDADKFQQYASKAGPIIAAHGGAMALRGVFQKALTGASTDSHLSSVIQFPDMAAMETWYASADYQAIIPLREEACDMTMLAYALPN